jgi:hypothetical protein
MLEKIRASAAYQQLVQWPPTATTVIGGGLLAGVASYHFTGSPEFAVFIASAFKLFCPQSGDAADKAVALFDKIPAGLRK